jgi:flagellar hook-associated protein 3 FlgL
MTTNNMLLNMSRNAAAVDSLYSQLVTGKKIQLPSDNPIIASRALKFRTNIFETEQYASNVNQGTSWMEITEQALSNVSEALDSVKELAQEGTTSTFNINNKQTFADQLQAILDRLSGEMNVTYAGRYVFSGYRTDKPPVLTKANSGASYDITQSLKSVNLETATVYTQANTSDVPTVSTVTKFKLPYTGANGTGTPETFPMQVYDATGNAVGAPVNVTVLANANTATGGTDSAYSPDPDAAYYIQDTGELILGKDVAATVTANPKGRVDVSYTKNGLEKGDLNPEIYFDCTDNISGKTYTMNGQNIQYEFGVNTRVAINNLAKDNLTATLYGDLKSLINTVNGVSLSTRDDLVAKYQGTYSGAELDEVIDKHMTDEKQYYEGVLHDAFSNMITIVETHKDQASKEYTQLGSRMNRLELIQNRLAQDKLSYTTLMTNNENVDYFEASMNLNAANYVYQMALKAGGGIMQTSLADFIR